MYFPKEGNSFTWQDFIICASSRCENMSIGKRKGTRRGGQRGGMKLKAKKEGTLFFGAVRSADARIKSSTQIYITYVTLPLLPRSTPYTAMVDPRLPRHPHDQLSICRTVKEVPPTASPM